MTGAARPRGPGWARALLARVLPRRDAEQLVLEMDDLYARRVARHGAARAHLWYLRQLVRFALVWAGAGLAAAARALTGMLQWFVRDVRHGLVSLARRPGYAAATVITLGVGVGGVAAIYSVANWVLLRRVPGVAANNRLVTMQLELRSGGSFAFPMSDPDLRDLKEGIVALDRLEASAAAPVHVQLGDGPPRRMTAEVVTDGYFDLLGLRVALGRAPAGESGTVLISHRLWRDAWAGQPGVLGSELRINGHAYQVVGVAAPGFHGAELPGEADLWLPRSAFAHVDPTHPPNLLDRRDVDLWRRLLGELAPGATLSRITVEAERVITGIRETHRGSAHSFLADFVVRAYPGLGLSPFIRGSVQRTLLLLAATAGLLLVLALANVTNLALAHGTARASQYAVLAALGAGRTRLALHALAEHLLLGVGGGVAGLAAGAIVVSLFRHARLSPHGASLQGIELDVRVLLFTLVIAVLAGLAAGVIPALAAARPQVMGVLRAGRHGARGSFRLQSALVVTQVALSMVLLVGAGLLGRSLVNMRAIDLGFEPDRALRFSLDPRIQGRSDAEILAMMDAALRRLQAMPGVEAAGFIAPAPVSLSYYTIHLYPPGGDPEDNAIHGAQYEVTGDFLRAMGARLLAGQWLTDDEAGPRASGAEVPIVITRRAAAVAFPDVPPAGVVGRQLVTSDGKRAFRVAGVIESVQLLGPHDGDPLAIFRPWQTGFGSELTGWVRTTVPPASLGTAVAGVLNEVESTLPVYELEPANDRVDSLIIEERTVVRLLLALALVGLLLAGVGLQGMLGYAVARRRREIGVRAALGATPREIVAGFIGRGLLLAGAGAALGLMAALALTDVIESRLFGVTALDPWTHAAVATGLMLVAALAAWGPARRSTRIPPTEALRAD